MKKLLLASLVFAFITSISLVLVWHDYQSFLDSVALPREESITYKIEPGTPFIHIVRDMQADGYITHPLYWRIYARLSKRTTEIKAGEYLLKGPLTPQELLDRLTEGRTLQFSMTIPEGWSYAQLLSALQQHPKIISTLTETDDVMAMLGNPGMVPEGWFLPETYHFPNDTTDIEFLSRSYQLMQNALAAEWAQKSAELPFKIPYEALILASIVEKETAIEVERPMIAAVFISRLNKGMRLQTDPTVIYGMGSDYQGNIRKRDLETASPYNTYLNTGLTPTPIALPGIDAIHAVLHPAQTDALYFVAKGDGSHHFSNTYKEHTQAVIKYQLAGKAGLYNNKK